MSNEIENELTESLEKDGKDSKLNVQITGDDNSQILARKEQATGVGDLGFPKIQIENENSFKEETKKEAQADTTATPGKDGKDNAAKPDNGADAAKDKFTGKAQDDRDGEKPASDEKADKKEGSEKKDEEAVSEKLNADDQTSDSAEKKLDKPVLSEDTKKRISTLIDKLGDDQYPVRTKAQRDIVKMGSAAFDSLKDAAKNNPDLEIRQRAKRAVEEILNRPPAALAAMAEMKDGAAADIAKTGSLSKESREKYQKFINSIDELKMGPTEQKARQDWADTVAKNFDAPPDQKRSLTKEYKSLSAMRLDPSSQARMDYADSLMAGNDKKEAIKVLADAVTKNPALAKYATSDTFQKLARESGALDDKDFVKAVDKATGKPGTTKEWTEPRAKVVQDIGHLTEQTARFGVTKELEKKWDTLLSDLTKRAEKEPDLAKFLELRTASARKDLVDFLAADGKLDRAKGVLRDMTKADPTWEQSAWHSNMEKVLELKKK